MGCGGADCAIPAAGGAAEVSSGRRGTQFLLACTAWALRCLLARFQEQTAVVPPGYAPTVHLAQGGHRVNDALLIPVTEHEVGSPNSTDVGRNLCPQATRGVTKVAALAGCRTPGLTRCAATALAKPRAVYRSVFVEPGQPGWVKALLTICSSCAALARSCGRTTWLSAT